MSPEAFFDGTEEPIGGFLQMWFTKQDTIFKEADWWKNVTSDYFCDNSQFNHT